MGDPKGINEIGRVKWTNNNNKVYSLTKMLDWFNRNLFLFFTLTLKLCSFTQQTFLNLLSWASCIICFSHKNDAEMAEASYLAWAQNTWLFALLSFFFFSFKFIYFFYLKDNCFTELCWFLPNIKWINRDDTRLLENRRLVPWITHWLPTDLISSLHTPSSSQVGGSNSLKSL